MSISVMDRLDPPSYDGQPVHMHNQPTSSRPTPSKPPPHSNQQLYFVKAWDGWKWPLGQSMTRGDTLLLALRGTMYVHLSGLYLTMTTGIKSSLCSQPTLPPPPSPYAAGLALGRPPSRTNTRTSTGRSRTTSPGACTRATSATRPSCSTRSWSSCGGTRTSRASCSRATLWAAPSPRCSVSTCVGPSLLLLVLIDCSLDESPPWTHRPLSSPSLPFPRQACTLRGTTGTGWSTSTW